MSYSYVIITQCKAIIGLILDKQSEGYQCVKEKCFLNPCIPVGPCLFCPLFRQLHPLVDIVLFESPGLAHAMGGAVIIVDPVAPGGVADSEVLAEYSII